MVVLFHSPFYTLNYLLLQGPGQQTRTYLSYLLLPGAWANYLGRPIVPEQGPGPETYDFNQDLNKDISTKKSTNQQGDFGGHIMIVRRLWMRVQLIVGRLL